MGPCAFCGWSACILNHSEIRPYLRRLRQRRALWLSVQHRRASWSGPRT
ncbi:unnamed protein product [Amoebophrya sp. A120]|nr:unnamed protein product [Amoebophrya sp. A120]|eukprot:GSA120T00016179001.1